MPQVLAQEDDQEDDKETVELERVQVTGSRLGRIDFEGASPVTIFTRDDIERTGAHDVGELLRQIPAVTGSPQGTAQNNAGDGSSRTDLRGLGPVRTLVLLNGRRQDSGTGTSFDFSTLPLAAIERIEVLKEGASAIYGADAVAGVINVITRRGFSGARVQAQYGGSFELERNPAAETRPEWAGSDGNSGRISVVLGNVGERGSFLIGAERTEQDPVYQGNIPDVQFRRVILGAAGVLADGFPRCLETGSCTDTGGSPSNLGGVFRPVDPEDGLLGFFARDLETGEIRPFDPATDLFNFAPMNFIQTPFTRTGAFAQAEYRLFDGVSAWIETRWSNRESEQELAPTPLFIGLLQPGAPLDNIPGEGVPASNAFNPFGLDVANALRRVAETRRRFQQDVERVHADAGLRGDFEQFGTRWSWDAALSWGRTDQDNTDLGQFVGDNFLTAIGPSFFDENGNAVCGTPEDPIRTVNDQRCVPLDLFGGFGTITQEMLDFVGAPLEDHLETRLLVFDAVIQGDVARLPAGPAGLALGFQFRDQELTNTPDPNKAAGETTGSTFQRTSGSFDVNSWFVEANVPLLADVPGADLLEVGAGVRLDDYSTIGDNIAVMFTGRWKPRVDLLLRASYSDVFREPTIFDLFTPRTDRLLVRQDPCSTNFPLIPMPVNRYAELTPEQRERCRMTGVPAGGFEQVLPIRTRVGGNPDLDPESGDTVTVGLAHSPSALPGLSLTVDYWQVELDDALEDVPGDVVLDQCIIRGNLEFCDSIIRQSTGNVGEVDHVLAPIRNAARLTARGFDIEAAYNRSTTVGLWSVRTLWTYLDKRSLQVVPGDKVFDAAGRTTNLGQVSVGDGVWPQWKGLTTLDWTRGDWSASVSWEYLDSVTEFPDDENPTAGRKVPRVNYFDFTGSYHTPWGPRVTAGVTNAFNTDPPFIFSGRNVFTDPNTYRMLGRSWFVRLTHEF